MSQLIPWVPSAVVADYIRLVLEKHGDGKINVRAAAKAMRCSEADRKYLDRIVRRPPRQMEVSRLFRIGDCLERLQPGAKKRIVRTIYPPKAESVVTGIRRGSKWADNATPAELKKLRSLVEENVAARKALQSFREWAEAKRHHPEVIEVCERRILGPLAAFRRTKKVCPGWDNLDSAQQAAFVRYGVQREKMMLGDTSFAMRALVRFSPKTRPKQRPPFQPWRD